MRARRYDEGEWREEWKMSNCQEQNCLDNADEGTVRAVKEWNEKIDLFIGHSVVNIMGLLFMRSVCLKSQLARAW